MSKKSEEENYGPIYVNDDDISGLKRPIESEGLINFQKNQE
jgi:hypothetical protein